MLHPTQIRYGPQAPSNPLAQPVNGTKLRGTVLCVYFIIIVLRGQLRMGSYWVRRCAKPCRAYPLNRQTTYSGWRKQYNKQSELCENSKHISFMSCFYFGWVQLGGDQLDGKGRGRAREKRCTCPARMKKWGRERMLEQTNPQHSSTENSLKAKFYY